MRALILIALVAVAAAYHQECGVNSHFESCGTACPLTCDNYDNPPKVCVLRCDIGCQCDAGYVKTSDGRCVRPEDCPSRALERPVCGKNQHFEECGSACPLTCDNYANPPKACVLMCVPGCHCDKGFVKTKDGRCVRAEECEASAPNSACLQEKETGPCRAIYHRYFFNKETGKCEKFIYGGCLGNDNNFSSKDDCEAVCLAAHPVAEKTCDEEPERGMCLAYMPKWYYDAKTGKCERFIYGGCGGNGNRYNTEEECLQNCRASAPPSACLEEKETGPCHAFFERYFFNKDTGKCEKFIYGGCRGNSNNFSSQEDCEAVCLA